MVVFLLPKTRMKQKGKAKPALVNNVRRYVYSFQDYEIDEAITLLNLDTYRLEGMQ